VSVPLGDAPAASQLKVDKEFQYYGWQSLLVDAVVFGLGTAVNPLVFVLLLPSGPVIHAVHRNFLMMGISGGVRGLGALLFLIGGIQKLKRALASYELQPVPIHVLHGSGKQVPACVRSFVDLAGRTLQVARAALATQDLRAPQRRDLGYAR